MGNPGRLSALLIWWAAASAAAIGLTHVSAARVAAREPGFMSARTQAQSTSKSSLAQRDTERALLDRYCVTCHNDRLRTAGLSLQSADLDQLGRHAQLWEKVAAKLRARAMPPPSAPRPDTASYDDLVSWLEA